MLIGSNKIDSHNDELLKKHQNKFAFTTSEIGDAEAIIKKLMAFQIAIPSWALGTGGTRFGRFSGGGEPRNLAEKIEDVALINALNRSSNSISLHIPWDIPKDAEMIKNFASDY